MKFNVHVQMCKRRSGFYSLRKPSLRSPPQNETSIYGLSSGSKDKTLSTRGTQSSSYRGKDLVDTDDPDLYGFPTNMKDDQLVQKHTRGLHNDFSFLNWFVFVLFFDYTRVGKVTGSTTLKGVVVRKVTHGNYDTTLEGPVEVTFPRATTRDGNRRRFFCFSETRISTLVF